MLFECVFKIMQVEIGSLNVKVTVRGQEITRPACIGRPRPDHHWPKAIEFCQTALDHKYDLSLNYPVRVGRIHDIQDYLLLLQYLIGKSTKIIVYLPFFTQPEQIDQILVSLKERLVDVQFRNLHEKWGDGVVVDLGHSLNAVSWVQNSKTVNFQSSQVATGNSLTREIQFKCFMGDYYSIDNATAIKEQLCKVQRNRLPKAIILKVQGKAVRLNGKQQQIGNKLVDQVKRLLSLHKRVGQIKLIGGGSKFTGFDSQIFEFN